MYHLTASRLVEFDVTYTQERYLAKTAVGNITFLEWGTTPEEAAEKIQKRIDLHEKERCPSLAKKLLERIKKTFYSLKI